jgi:hypothetical protein
MDLDDLKTGFSGLESKFLKEKAWAWLSTTKPYTVAPYQILDYTASASRDLAPPPVGSGL